ncbi:BAR-domain-containing protein [Tothia fuscella]|uniref:BAR-domain-containing protein n=1 Tax=Tothia fuscella TaxID=1048955 RepID=A0A9P4TT81_9PEZI|nr:BAR-domain-containing protein [Tothia fuscella]
MNTIKKLDRFKQWAGEKMGGEAKTSTSEDFKALEAEMNLRHEGMDKLQKSMTVYIKSLSKRNEGEDREKLLPVGYLGSTMIAHGQDFSHDSEFGNCLQSMGRANESIARRQETYVANATASWLESLERSLAQMKEYQAARKKLETRRLAYDASLAKMQKAKKEDFRVEEELRAQKAKYEESNEDVFRRMEDIKEAEVESVNDMTSFLDAELAYYDSCKEILLQLKKEWPGPQGRNDLSRTPSRIGRTRSNTAHSYTDRFNEVEEEPEPAPRVTIPKRGARTGSPPDQARPNYQRSYTSSSVQNTASRDYSPVGMQRLTRVPTEPTALLAANRSNLRPVNRTRDDYSPDRTDRFVNNNDRSESPTTSHGSTPSRVSSWAASDNGSLEGRRKAPPPPPPSRAKKPAPPPPMKRSALSTSEIPSPKNGDGTWR